MKIIWRTHGERHGATHSRIGSVIRSTRMRTAISLVLLIALLGGAALWRGWISTSAAAEHVNTVPISKGDLSITVDSSGSVQAARSVDLAFSTSGYVREVLVKPGDRVEAGQPLARLDDADLKLKVAQAEADLRMAQADLTAAREGSATEQEIDEAQANVASAEANLQQTRTNNVTAADLADAAAVVRMAEANLEKARTGNITAADLAEAQAAVDSAAANLEQARTGNYTAEDLAQAEADVRTAEARVKEIEGGATPAEASAAQLALTEAQIAYDEAVATASTAKTNAERDMTTAAEQVRSAQDTYSSAYWVDQQAQAGVDPETGRSFENLGKDSATEQRRYAEALREAERKLRQAETVLEGAKVAFEQAKEQEPRDVAAAQAKLDDAQTQYKTALQGAKESARVEAQAQLDQARAKADKIRKGGTPSEVAAAQAQLDQAKAHLQKLKQGGTKADVAAAQAQLDQARAGLRKLQQGGTAAEIAAAQAQLDQAQAGLEQLSAPKAPSAIETAEAKVAQAQAQVEAAQLALQQATLTAPFAGTIATVGVQPGSSASTTDQAALKLVDLATLHVDLNLSETDVAKVQPGQAVSLTFDALEEQTLSGSVESVAPTASGDGEVVTYNVRIQFKPEAAAIKVGMTANASIEVERRAGVLQVPNRAIQSQGPIKTVQVVAKQGQPPVTITVETGVTNGTHTELVRCLDTGTQCLREGDQVALPTPDGVAGPDAPNSDQMISGPAPAPNGAPVIRVGP